MVLKLIEDHHVKPKIIKIPVENVEENVWQIFLDRTQKHKPQKTNFDDFHSTKIKIFSSLEDTVKK